ncbi:MAG: hypothetical protein ACR2HO_02435 [Rubrobacteraceae bacterium]|nr:hypothetical protein [Rubrobacter sp.]
MSTSRGRDLDESAIADLLRQSRVDFVVADPGLPLRWIPAEECFVFWKSEVKTRVADPAVKRHRLENYPDEYFYFASEWQPFEDRPVVLLEANH